MNILHLLRLLSLTYFQKEKTKLGVAIAGMILGIAVYASIRIANETAIQSFEKSTSLVSGPSSISVQGMSGKVSEDIYETMHSAEGIFALTPLSSRFVSFKKKDGAYGTIQIIGIDVLSPASKVRTAEFTTPRNSVLELLSQPPSGLVSSQLTEALTDDQKISLLIEGKESSIQVRGTLPDTTLSNAYGGNVLVLDISIYQELFGEFGFVDRFSILPDEDFSKELLIETLGTMLGSEFEIKESGALYEAGRSMSAAFRLNLTFLAGISIVVAVLLIYNLSSYHLLRRRKDLGTLVSIGARRTTLFKVLTIEALLLGLLASTGGIFLGYLFSWVSIDLVTNTFSTMYSPIATESPALSFSLIIECFIIGIISVLAGSILPALELFKIPPKETFGYQTFEAQFQTWIPSLSYFGFFVFFSSLFVSQLPLLSYSLYYGFLPPALLIASVIALSPLFLKKFLHITGKAATKFNAISMVLAIDHIQQTLRRNSVAMASIVVAIAMGLGISIMITSFRDSVEDWITKVTMADLYLSASPELTTHTDSIVPEEVVEYLKKQPEIAAVDWISSASTVIRNAPSKVMGTSFDILDSYPRLLLITPMSADELSSLAKDPHSVLVSESLSNKLSIATGDTITIPGISEARTGTVRGIYKDFSSEQGAVLISYELFVTLFSHQKKEAVSVYLHDKEMGGVLREKIRKDFSDIHLQIRNNIELRKEVLAIFDQTFMITRALRIMVGVLALLILLTCTSMLLLERKREFSVLHAIGASHKTIIRAVVSEAFLLGSSALIFGLFAGLLLSLFLVFKVNTFFFGWTLQYSLYPYEIYSTIVLVLFFSILSAALPLAGKGLKYTPEHLRYE
jgi:putative ABC transport system permease protein